MAKYQLEKHSERAWKLVGHFVDGQQVFICHEPELGYWKVNVPRDWMTFTNLIPQPYKSQSAALKGYFRRFERGDYT